MKKNDCPLAVSYGFPSGTDDFEFVGREGMIEISGHQVALVKILPLCNGFHTVAEICAVVHDVPSNITKRLIATCERHGLIEESRRLYRRFHVESANPAFFIHNLGLNDIKNLMKRHNRVMEVKPAGTISYPVLAGTQERRSVRNFGGNHIEVEVLMGLLTSMYRIGETHSVPSGGALFPITLYLILFIGSGGYKPGVYRFDSRSLELELMEALPIRERIERTFDTRELLEGAVGVVVIAGDMDFSHAKYANRGYRYTLIEAGHIAQNAYLYCANNPTGRLGVVEYGGFHDKPVANLLGLRFPRHAPIISLIFGVVGEVRPLTELWLRESMWTLRKSLVGPGKPVATMSVGSLSHGGISMTRWAAVAPYRRSAHQKSTMPRTRAYATGTLVSEACVKVLGEAYERHVCHQPRADLVAPVTELESWVDPRVFVPYESDHPVFNRYHLVPLDPLQKQAWVFGHDAASHRIAVPTDLLFFEKHKKQRSMCYRPNSTGVAAHPDIEQAKINAMLELVERDAIAVWWYAKQTPSRIPHDFFPTDLITRKKEWERTGWKLHVLNLTLDIAPVCLVLAENVRGRYPAIASGAGCGLSLRDAIHKAFAEFEYMALSWQKRRKQILEPEQVRSPDQHGLLHATGRYIGENMYLLDAPEADPSTDEVAIETILDRVQPVTVRLDRGEYPLAVVRVLTAHLLPLTFGYATEHIGHKRLGVLGWKWDRPFPSIPHYFP